MSIRTLVLFGSGLVALGTEAFGANPSFSQVLTDTNAVMVVGEPGIVAAWPLSGNPITAGGTSGDRDPTVCYVTNLAKYFIYYARTPADYTVTSVNIGGKVSFDGTNWTDLGLVLDVNGTASRFDSGSVGSPFAFVENNIIYLYYQGTTNKAEWGSPGNAHAGLATSTDGTNFTRVTAGTPICATTGYGPGVGKQGSTYVLFTSQTSLFTIQRATNSTGPDSVFVNDSSFIWIGRKPYNGHEEAAPVKLSGDLNYVFVDMLESPSQTKNDLGVGFYWTTNLLGGTNVFVWGGTFNKQTSTNGWNVSGYGSSGVCLMTNGYYLLVSDGYATNASTLATRRIGGTVMQLGKVSRRLVPQNFLTDDGSFDIGSGVWFRVASRPRWMNSRINVAIMEGNGGDGSIEYSFGVNARRSITGSALVGSITPLTTPIDVGSGLGLDQVRITAGASASSAVNFDIHIATGYAGTYTVTAEGYPSTADLVYPYNVPDAPSGETLLSAVTFANPAANSVWQFSGSGWFPTNTPTVANLYNSGLTASLPIYTDANKKSVSGSAPLTVYAAGTAYTLTATPALLDFGTTDPSITLATAGTYMIQANVGTKYNGSTYASAQTVTLKLRRTNNTAADLTSGSRTVEMPFLVAGAAFTGGDVMAVPPVIYTATAGDIIQIFGSLSATPPAGSVTTDSAEIVAIRLY